VGQNERMGDQQHVACIRLTILASNFVVCICASNIVICTNHKNLHNFYCPMCAFHGAQLGTACN
jgi:hypothetical protein